MKKFYDIINVLPFSLLFQMLFGAYAGIPEGSAAGYLICLFFTVWIVFLHNMEKRNRLRSIGIVSVFAAGLVIAAGKEYRHVFINEYLWVFWIICFSVIALITGILSEKNIWFGRAAALTLFIYCIGGTILEWNISKAAFSIICFILLIRIAEEVQRRWKKSGFPDIREHITRIAPLFIALCLAVYFIPVKNEPYDWRFVKNIYNCTVSCINRIYGYIVHTSDDYGKIGFSDNAGFLAGLDSNDEEVLFITSDNMQIRDMKLVGCISGDFRGNEWVFGADETSLSRMTDTLETTCAVRKYSDSSRSDFLQKIEMNCETLFYNTRYIFSPTKIRLEATSRKNHGLSEKNGSIISKKRFNYKDSYQLSCYVLNYSNPHLEDFLLDAGPISESEWEQTAKAEEVFNKEGYSFEDYQEYLKDIYSNYCHTYGLTGKVGEIVSKIKNSSDSRYEVLKKLEAYLRDMEYSTDCGQLPDSVSDAQSFLDHFLITSQKGYCMHFATAFVLMANEMGFPCRYVQGYNVFRDVSGTITVKQSNAHSWPEAYFDNVGWIAFEPTPGYSLLGGWITSDSSSYAPDYDISDLRNIDEQNKENDDAEESESESDKIDPLIFLIPSFAVIGFLLLFYAISRYLSRRKYKKMNCYDKFICLAQQVLRFLGYLGFRMENDETLSEFSSRILRSDREDIKRYIGFIPVYEAVLYSDKKVTDEEIRSTENICNALREIVKKSKLRYKLLLLIK